MEMRRRYLYNGGKEEINIEGTTAGCWEVGVGGGGDGGLSRIASNGCGKLGLDVGF